MRDVEEWLYSRIGLNFRSGLDRVRVARDLLGRPDKAYPIIHVTGTNGKGSTIAFMRALFTSHGRRVGTFTSPHMVSVHDRICIDDQPISDEDLASLAERIATVEQDLPADYGPLSFFEILTLIALLYFQEQAVDVVLLEVGIGGLLDTTNIVTGDLSLISSVGLDHEETLGSDLLAICEQKAGIFKAGKMALIGPLPSECQLLCAKKAADLGVDLQVYGQDFCLENNLFKNGQISLSLPQIGLAGAYQKENAALALQAFLTFMQAQNWPVSEEKLAPALSATSWAGRLEQVLPKVYLDGAHNLPAMERLVDFIREQAGKKTILFGALKRKDYRTMLAYLGRELPEVELVVTSFGEEGAVEQADVPDLPYAPSYLDFLGDFVAERPQDLLFVIGSLHFVAEVRNHLLAGQKN